MLIFRTGDKLYRGDSAVAIVSALEKDAGNYPHRGRPLRHFLNWSLERLRHHIPPRDIDLSDRIEEEALAFNYLSLRDEYGAGTLTVRGDRSPGENG